MSSVAGLMIVFESMDDSCYLIVFENFLTIDIYMQQVGMCHVSEIADHYVKDIDKHYKVGDRVRARVVKVCANFFNTPRSPNGNVSLQKYFIFSLSGVYEDNNSDLFWLNFCLCKEAFLD